MVVPVLNYTVILILYAKRNTEVCQEILKILLTSLIKFFYQYYSKKFRDTLHRVCNNMSVASKGYYLEIF